MKNKIRETVSCEEITQVFDACRYDRITKSFVVFCLGKFINQEEVEVLAKIRIKPEILFDLALRLVCAARIYDEKTGKRVLPDDFYKDNETEEKLETGEKRK